MPPRRAYPPPAPSASRSPRSRHRAGHTRRPRGRTGLGLPLIFALVAGCELGSTDFIELGRAPGSELPDGATEASAPSLTQCSSAAACAEPTPHCDAQTGACAECLTPAHCGAPNLTCVHGRCVSGCSDDIACPADAPRCHVDSGRCLRCATDSDCTTGDDTRCDLDLGRCVDCIDDGHCPDASRPHCEPLARECVRCVTDAHCPAGTSCSGPVGRYQCTG